MNISTPTNSSFTNAITNSTTSLNATTASLQPDTTYYWRVRSGNGTVYSTWSAIWSFSTEFRFTSAPALVSPANGTQNVATTGTSLQWGLVYGATAYEYQIADNSTFTNAITNTTSSLTAHTGTLQPNTTYFWKVRASNGTVYSDWSAVWSFSSISTAGIDDIPANNLITVFPNPANDVIHIKVPEIRTVSNYIITDISGKLISEGKLTDELTTICLEKLKTGIYILSIEGYGNKVLNVIKK